ncbi:MAG TPA: hypothetical protein VHG51_20910 [Longimicrobiaceae bacterium]|nr:hypothetical protein [Longimicrobiaceae bacterium]
MPTAPAPPAPVHPADDAPAGPVRSGHGDVSRTWELELLISGAVIFALLQPPALVDSLYERLNPHLTREAGMLLFLGYWYVQASLYALIACFTMHLAARAYWVGLIGLDSVFPAGVRWDNLRQGPYLRAAYRDRLPSLPALIVRIDNFCSVIFSFAFVTVILFVISVLLSAAAGGAAFALSGLLFGGEHFLAVLYTLLAVLALPMSLLSVADKRMGERVDPASRPGRLLRFLAAASYRVNMVGLYGPILLTLFSNTRKRIMYPVFAAFVVGLLAMVAGQLFTRLGILSVNSYEFFPEEAGASVVSPAYYESQRPAGEVFPRTPSIQSDVVRDPFVKLFIPYSPERHDAALGRACPGLPRLQDTGVRFGRARGDAPDAAAADAVLRCFARVHAVRLNGAPVEALDLSFHTHPRSGLRGVIAYLPTAELPRGRNVLRVERVPRARPRPGDEPPEPDVIPFWL